MSNQFRVGEKVWVNCEVKPGPFSNERLTRIDLPDNPWVGFVDVAALKDGKMKKGQNGVLARVLKLSGQHVLALVQGHALDSRQIWAPIANVEKAEPRVSLTS